jgi:hypothetical protein
MYITMMTAQDFLYRTSYITDTNDLEVLDGLAHSKGTGRHLSN